MSCQLKRLHDISKKTESTFSKLNASVFLLQFLVRCLGRNEHFWGEIQPQKAFHDRLIADGGDVSGGVGSLFGLLSSAPHSSSTNTAKISKKKRNNYECPVPLHISYVTKYFSTYFCNYQQIPNVAMNITCIDPNQKYNLPGNDDDDYKDNDQSDDREDDFQNSMHP